MIWFAVALLVVARVISPVKAAGKVREFLAVPSASIRFRSSACSARLPSFS